MTKLASANGFQLRLSPWCVHGILRTEKACANACVIGGTEQGNCEIRRKRGRFLRVRPKNKERGETMILYVKYTEDL